MNRLSTQAFRDEVEAAKEGVSVYLSSYPDDQMLQSILAQLQYVTEWSSKGADSTDPKLEILNFGLMASHAVEELDPGLAMHLYHLAGEIDAKDS